MQNEMIMANIKLLLLLYVFGGAKISIEDLPEYPNFRANFQICASL
jgi:hypothetical protein